MFDKKQQWTRHVRHEPSDEPERLWTLTMLPEIRGLKRSFEIIDSSSSVFLGGNCRTAVKKERETCVLTPCQEFPAQSYLASFMKYVLWAPFYRWRKPGLWQFRNLPKVAELINGWTGLKLVTHFPGETGNVLPRAHVCTRCMWGRNWSSSGSWATSPRQCLWYKCQHFTEKEIIKQLRHYLP